MEHTARPIEEEDTTTARRSARHLIGAGLALLLFLPGCSFKYDDDFVCGARVGASADTDTCDGTRRELCVCVTGGCAKPDRKCKSKYRYRESPFAPDGYADNCVDQGDLKSAISQFTQGPTCAADAGAGAANKHTNGDASQ